VTWLPITVEAACDRDAVLGMHPEAYARHRAFLEVCEEVADPDLLEVCRARMAQMLGCREELARHSAERLADLRSWERSPLVSARQRVALAFVEQFLLDPALISRQQAADLEAELGTSGVIDFTAVIAAFEASFRLSTLLNLAPAPAAAI
jgi:alkylhydroperoxidase family enzyme